jgi:HSP20 family protein
MSMWRPVEDLMTLPVDVYETDGAFVVEARVPGVNPDDLEITVTEESLTIKSKFVIPEGAQGRQWLSRELWCGGSTRVLTLGSAVDVDKVEAAFKDGLLTLTIQKREEIKPKSVKVKIS